MGGNGRWAAARGQPRVRGPEAGARSIREIVRAAADWKIGRLTLFAFSVDNWKRPQEEIDLLMHLLLRYLRKELPRLVRRGIRFMAVGRTAELAGDVLREIRRCERKTRSGSTLTLALALNYGGQEEILDAARDLAARCARGELRPEEITREEFERGLYAGHREAPPPDLLIRTAGEMRVSNFLLWQISYTEIWVTDVCWPDFRREHLAAALKAYAHRKRKFGGLKKKTGKGGESAKPPAKGRAARSSSAAR